MFASFSRLRGAYFTPSFPANADALLLKTNLRGLQKNRRRYLSADQSAKGYEHLHYDDFKRGLFFRDADKNIPILHFDRISKNINHGGHGQGLAIAHIKFRAMTRANHRIAIQ